MGAGQALMSFTGIIDQFFAANLGAGAISTLSYANRVLGLILSLGAMAISRATLPEFSAVHARGELAQLEQNPGYGRIGSTAYAKSRHYIFGTADAADSGAEDGGQIDFRHAQTLG
jgi:hypothetical protein